MNAPNKVNSNTSVTSKAANAAIFLYIALYALLARKFSLALAVGAPFAAWVMAGAAIVQLRKIAAAYGCAAEKASTALADIESSPAFAAEKQAAARFIAIRSAARTTPRDKTVADLRALVEELPDTRAAAEARAVIQKLTP